MKGLNDREWVDHCTASASEGLQKLATGAMFSLHLANDKMCLSG